MDRQFARAIRAYLALAEHRATVGSADQERAIQEEGGARTPGIGDENTSTGFGGDGDKGKEGRGASGGGGGGGSGSGMGEQYAHVFRMIEQHSLFDTVQVRGG